MHHHILCLSICNQNIVLLLPFLCHIFISHGCTDSSFQAPHSKRQKGLIIHKIKAVLLCVLILKNCKGNPDKWTLNQNCCITTEFYLHCMMKYKFQCKCNNHHNNDDGDHHHHKNNRMICHQQRNMHKNVAGKKICCRMGNPRESKTTTRHKQKTVHIVLLAFCWSIWCPQCQRSRQYLQGDAVQNPN